MRAQSPSHWTTAREFTILFYFFCLFSFKKKIKYESLNIFIDKTDLTAFLHFHPSLGCSPLIIFQLHAVGFSLFDGVNSEHLFLTVLETENYKIKVLADSVSSDNPLPGLQMVNHLLAVSSDGGKRAFL